MLKQFLRKLIPSEEVVQNNRALRLLQPLLRPELFLLTRRSAAMGFAIGIFFGWMPPPVPQMLSASLGALLYFKLTGKPANLPLATVTVWFSNPITWGPVWIGGGVFGAWVLGMLGYDANAYADVVFTWDWLTTHGVDWVYENTSSIVLSMFFGTAVLGLLTATLGYLFMYYLWTWQVMRKYRSRHPLPSSKKS